MGKNLKAIAVRGERICPWRISKAWFGKRQGQRYMREHKFFHVWQEQGLMGVIEYANSKGILPTHNFTTVFSGHDKINGETMLDQYKIGDSAVSCVHVLRQHLPGQERQIYRHCDGRP